MELKIEGLDKIEIEAKDLIDIIEIEKAMGKACALVEGEARKKAPKGKTGHLKQFMDSKVEYEGDVLVGTVFNPLEYAPYVEYGTGLFAETQGKQGGWGIPIGKEFTKAQAKKYGYPIYTGSDGKQYAFTLGSRPHPYLRPALYENREKIIRLLGGSIK